jgi:hypothetical protein
MFVLFYFRLVKPQYLVPFLQPGRLVRVKQADKDFGFGVVINFKKKAVKVTSAYQHNFSFSFYNFYFIYERESFLICFFISSKKLRKKSDLDLVRLLSKIAQLTLTCS